MVVWRGAWDDADMTMRMLAWGLVGAMGMIGMARAQQGTSLAFERAGHLRRGINLSMWYAQTSDHSAAHIQNYTTADDFKLVKSLGFDHVRVSIDPEPLILNENAGTLRADAIGRLDETVTQLLAAGLNVVLDVHPEEAWKAKLEKGDDSAAQLMAFWMTFAQHFAATDPERVVFEILNEPNMQDWYRWEGVQARTVARIRAAAPRHTIIATASGYSKIDGLLAMEPVRDENVIYTFHEYDPMWFTHQGATWGTQGLGVSAGASRILRLRRTCRRCWGRSRMSACGWRCSDTAGTSGMRRGWERRLRR